jgi:hypothetical protein
MYTQNYGQNMNNYQGPSEEEIYAKMTEEKGYDPEALKGLKERIMSLPEEEQEMIAAGIIPPNRVADVT